MCFEWQHLFSRSRGIVERWFWSVLLPGNVRYKTYTVQEVNYWQ